MVFLVSGPILKPWRDPARVTSSLRKSPQEEHSLFIGQNLSVFSPRGFYLHFLKGLALFTVMGLKHSRTSAAFLLRCGLLVPPRHPHCCSWAPREVVNVKLKWSELNSGLQVPPTQPGVEWAHPLPCQAHSLYEASDSF